MKKILFTLPALLLAVLMSGCGTGPDAELSARVSESADWLCFVDGKLAVQTKLYKDHQKEILAKLKDLPMAEDTVRSRMLIFGSVKEKWGGVLLQSTDAHAKKFYDFSLADCKKDDKKTKESTQGGIRSFITPLDNNTTALIALCHDNLLLVGINRTDPAFFSAKSPNPLFGKILTKGNIISAAAKVELPPQGKVKEIDGIVKVIPALKKFQSVTLNVPFSVDKPEVTVRGVFADAAAANETLAAFNLGLNAGKNSGSKGAAHIDEVTRRTTEKNAVIVSFQLTELVRWFIDAAKEDQKKTDN